jgi:hypothetical protein
MLHSFSLYNGCLPCLHLSWLFSPFRSSALRYSGGSVTLAYIHAKERANAEPTVDTTSLGKIASGSLIDAAFDLLASTALGPVQWIRELRTLHDLLDPLHPLAGGL